jgi:hypothetical protein
MNGTPGAAARPGPAQARHREPPSSGDPFSSGEGWACTGACAAIWPPVRGVPEVARGVKLPGKFGRIKGQVTYNGWPLYLFTGEKSHQNHADSSFKVVRGPAPSKKASPSPTPTGSW